MKILIPLILLSFMLQNSSLSIFDFKKEKNTSNWYVVNDAVMGGLSQGELLINHSENGLFKGYVTTENNGGFSSIRHELNKKEVSKFEQVILKVKGDGKTYQFRIKSKLSQRYYYITPFKTTGKWETIKMPFNLFYASFRGYTLDKPNYSGEQMAQIAILIGNNKKESFALEIEKIYLE